MATEKEGIEERLAALEWELNKRDKELNCIYGIAALEDQPGITLEEIIQGIVDLMPAAWQYPEIACARAILEGQEFKTENFRETPWKQTSDIVLHGERIGYLEFCYLEEKPESDEGPFLKEERNLINNIAERLGKITERVRAEEKYRIIFESAPDAYYLIDLKGKFIDGNKAAERITGYRKAELIGKSFLKLKMLPKNQFPKAAAILAKNALGKPTGPDEFTLIRKDGSEIEVEIVTHLLKIEGKTQVLGIARDITERVQAREVLQKERDRAQKYLDISGVMFVALNAKGVVTLINQKVCEVLGYEQEEIIGKNWFDNFLPGNVKGEVRTVFDRLMASEIEPVEYYENPCLTEGGEEKIIAWHNTLLEDDKGNIIGTLSSGEDITERVRAEEVLHQYKHIVSSSTDMLTLLDKRFNYLAVNKAFMEAFKLTPEQLIGNSMAKVFGEEFFNTLIKPNAQRCLGGEEVNYQEWFDYPAHGRRYMDITCYPYYSEDNKIAGFVVNGRDSTEREQAEENLRKSEQKFRNYVETSQDLMWECDAKGRFTYLNPAWEQVTGYKLSEMLGKPFTDFYIKEKVEKNSAEFGRHLGGGSVKGYPSTYISKNGSEIALIFKAIPLYDSNENTIGSQGSAYDITERVRAEKALKMKMDELEIFYNAAVDRELLINESRKEINELIRELGGEPKYVIVE